MRSFLLFIFAGLLSFSPALACRPMLTDDCGVIPRGSLLLETGVLSYSQSISSSQTLATTVTYGIAPNTQIAVDLPYCRISSNGNAVAGIGDVNVKAKVQISEAEINPFGFSFTVGSKLNNGDVNQGLGSGQSELFANAVLTRPTRFGAVHLNLGYTLTGVLSNYAAYNPINLSAILEYNLAEQTKIFSEIAGMTSQATAPLQLTLGLNKSFSEYLTLDCGAYFGLTDAVPKSIYTMGVTASLI